MSVMLLLAAVVIGFLCLGTSAMMGARGLQLRRQALASAAGLAVLFACFCSVIALQEYNYLGSFKLAGTIVYASFPVGSLIGSFVTLAICPRPNRPAEFSFIGVGAAFTFALILLLAVASQGGMGGVWWLLPIWHILVSSITFCLFKGFVGLRTRILVPLIGLVIFFIVILSLGSASKAKQQKELRGEAQISTRAVEQRWLPFDLTSPANFKWGTPTYTRSDFAVTGTLEGHRGVVQLSGGLGATYITFDLKTPNSFEFKHHPDSALTAKEAKDVERRAKTWLAASGISPNVGDHLFGLITEGHWDSQVIVPGHRSDGLHASKEYRINISIVPSVGRPKVEISFSDAAVMWDAFDPQFQQPNYGGQN